MSALQLVTDWPVDHVAAAVVTAESGWAGVDRPTTAVVDTFGDLDHEFRLASLSKCLTGWATLVAWEEGIVDLDVPVDHSDVANEATIRHLLSHAGGFAFDGHRPVASIETRRIYSNTGIDIVGDVVAAAADMTFDRYLAAAVFEPLGMTASELRGPPAYAVWSTVRDLASFVAEMLVPKLLAPTTARELTSIQYPDLAGIVPGVGSFNPNPWGLGVEIKGDKSPHWTGAGNSPATFGHFGGAGTMMWADPHHGVAVVALTDRPFDEWAPEALRRWPELSDAVLAEHRSAA